MCAVVENEKCCCCCCCRSLVLENAHKHVAFLVVDGGVPCTSVVGNDGRGRSAGCNVVDFFQHLSLISDGFVLHCGVCAQAYRRQNHCLSS